MRFTQITIKDIARMLGISKSTVSRALTNNLDVHPETKRKIMELATQLNPAGTVKLPLTMITNRGVKVWPQGFPETFCTDHWRLRFKASPLTPGRKLVKI